MFSSLLITLLLGSCAFAARPGDEIKIVDFNRSFYISNETYQFVLYPQFMVPLQVYRHVIYTATTATVNANIKRALWQNKKRLIELAPEDHDLLSNYMADPLPAFVKVNNKKRSLPADESGFRSVPLASGVALLVSEDTVVDTQKRAVKLGGTLCLHIPFFTTCDNAGDVDNVKKTLQTQVDALRTEVDSYKSTNNARANEMAKVLDQQRTLIQSLVRETTVSATLIDTVASAAATNAAQQAHGDFIAHAQINYLQRVTNSLLRYANAMASTDARSVVAQPSLSELFSGYMKVLTYLGQRNVTDGKLYAFTPIVDTRTFNWTENPLPAEVVKNRTEVAEPFVSNTTLIANLMGWSVVTTVACADSSATTTCPVTFVGSKAMQTNSLSEGGDQWSLGPIHQQHTGVYPVFPNFSTVSYQNVLSASAPPRVDGLNTPTQLFCVDFLGYKALSSFNSTPYMSNGIPTITVNPFSDCNNYLLRARQTHLTYFLYTIREGVVVPFYSNCEPTQLLNETATNLPFSYLSNYPWGGATLRDASLRTTNNGRFVYSVYHVNAEHWVSPNCYLNLEPEWVGLNYYINQQPTIIPNIPRGYKLNQFTINPAGELASSLEFVYTRDWAWVYKVSLVSQNTILVDEVNALDGSLVLFHVNGSTVVDASDSFYGKSNNGRDCIQKADTYEYDLTACFFQNDEKSYSSDQYLTGQVKTTGIARYTDKFGFAVGFIALNLSTGTQSSYQFTLRPKSEADFSYSVVYPGTICPKLVSSSTQLATCRVSITFTGTGNVTYGPKVDTATTRLTFPVSNPVASLDLTSGDYYFLVDGLQCIVLTCPADDTLTVTTVDVSSKTIDIVSAADKALNGSVSSAVGQSASDTLLQFKQIQNQVNQSRAALEEIQGKLGGIDFNTSRIVPYEDFTEARARVDKLISQIQPGGDRQCAQGVFGSAGCWFQDLLSALIVIGILAAIAFGIYCICFKCGVLGRIMGK